MTEIRKIQHMQRGSNISGTIVDEEQLRVVPPLSRLFCESAMAMLRATRLSLPGCDVHGLRYVEYINGNRTMVAELLEDLREEKYAIHWASKMMYS